MLGTIRAIEEELMQGGFIKRYSQRPDGSRWEGEGIFVLCNFWYVDNLVLQGRHDEALAFFEKLLGLANDVGLFSEQYDAESKRFLGNFPQAYSHVAIVNSARNLSQDKGPAKMRQHA